VDLSSLSLLTWNCFGAAQGVVAWWRWRGIPEGHRLEHPTVESTLRGVDVVCLQEVFLGEAEDMFSRLDHPYKTRDHNRAQWRPLSIGGSGLAVASRYPIVSTASRTFTGATVGAERLARKGAIHARVDVHGVLVDFFITHLQSGYGARSARVRARQMAQLREWTEALGAPGRAAIVCGDLNVDGRTRVREKEYATLRKVFDGFEDLGATRDHTTFHPHPDHNPLAHRYDPGAPVQDNKEQRIDYILFRPANGETAGAPERVLDTALEGTNTHPSDHYGLRVSLIL
jgi:endonuclease/exonuclease/phosphatase family metal-dependent hydrolase